MSVDSKPKVLVVGDASFLRDNAEFIKFCNNFELIHIKSHKTTTKDEIIEILQKESNSEGEEGIQGIFNVLGGLYMYPGGANSFMDFFPPSVKVYTYPWVGHDHLDLDKLTLQKIIACNVGSISAPHVADSALQLTLQCFRMTSFIEHMFKQLGDMDQVRAYIGGTEFDKLTHLPSLYDSAKGPKTKHLLGGKLISSPQGRTAGIVGLGAIGKEIAKRLSAIGMNIQYTKRTPLTDEEIAAAFPNTKFELKYFPTFTELIPNCDLLVFAVPHSPTTRHFINAETIKLVKPGVRIVNIGRGSAIDEEVLLQALDDGTVTSAGLDVFENEPKIDKRFLERWDVVATPHIGSMTTDNLILAHELSMQNITNVLLDHGKGISPINSI